MDLERSAADQAVESLDDVPVRVRVIALDSAVAHGRRLRPHAVGKGDSRTLAEGGQCLLGRFAAGGQQRGIQAIWRESTRGCENIGVTPVVVIGA